ncbi:hypothetical protein ABPG74_007537 [Tetrahymena malaccensis]
MRSQSSSMNESTQQIIFNENLNQQGLLQNDQGISSFFNGSNSYYFDINCSDSNLITNSQYKINESMKEKKQERKQKKEEKNLKMLQTLQSLPKRVLRSDKQNESYKQNQQDISEEISQKNNLENHDFNNNQHINQLEINTKIDDFSFVNLNQQKQQIEINSLQLKFLEQRQYETYNNQINQNQTKISQQSNIINQNNQQYLYQKQDQQEQILFQKQGDLNSIISQQAQELQQQAQTNFFNQNQEQIQNQNSFMVNESIFGEYDLPSKQILFENFQFNEELSYQQFDDYQNKYDSQIDQHLQFQNLLDSNDFNQLEQERQFSNNNQKQNQNPSQSEEIFQNQQDIQQVQLNKASSKSLQSKFNLIKLQKNNIVKNLMSTFKRFIVNIFEIIPIKKQKKLQQVDQYQTNKAIMKIYLDSDSQDDEHIIQKTRQSILNLYNQSENHKQCFDEKIFLKRFEKYIKNKSYNQHSMNLLMNNSSFSLVFKYFLQNFAQNWLTNSNISNQNSYKVVIEFLIKE